MSQRHHDNEIKILMDNDSGELVQSRYHSSRLRLDVNDEYEAPPLSLEALCELIMTEHDMSLTLSDALFVCNIICVHSSIIFCALFVSGQKSYSAPRIALASSSYLGLFSSLGCASTWKTASDRKLSPQRRGAENTFLISILFMGNNKYAF